LRIKTHLMNAAAGAAIGVATVGVGLVGAFMSGPVVAIAGGVSLIGMACGIGFLAERGMLKPAIFLTSAAATTAGLILATSVVMKNVYDRPASDTLRDQPPVTQSFNTVSRAQASPFTQPRNPTTVFQLNG